MFDAKKEIPTLAFLRAVGLDRKDLWDYKDGKDPIPIRRQIVLSRFIQDWEAGMLEFKAGTRRKGQRGGLAPQVLVHRTTPRSVPHRMVVTLEGAPRLKILPKMTASPRSGQISNTMTRLTRRAL